MEPGGLETPGLQIAHFVPSARLASINLWRRQQRFAHLSCTHPLRNGCEAESSDQSRRRYVEILRHGIEGEGKRPGARPRNRNRRAAVSAPVVDRAVDHSRATILPGGYCGDRGECDVVRDQR